MTVHTEPSLSPPPAAAPPAAGPAALDTAIDPSIDTSMDASVDTAVDSARRLLARSLADATHAERRRHRRLGRLLADPDARELTFGLTDEVLRLRDRRRSATRLRRLVDEHPPRAVGPLDAALLRTAAWLAPRVPGAVMPLVARRLRAEARGVVLPAEDPAFGRHVARRRDEGVRLNVNPLGEAILGDEEAEARLATVCARVDRPDVDYVSVKLSSIVANLDVLAFEHSLERACARLTALYRRAAASTPPVFVNLDMEEYRDLELTLQAFMRVLSHDDLRGVDAGIVLQAYLPDAHEALERLGTWATARRAAGGGSVKVRIVKGANLAMERVEAELHGWVPAPYGSKADVDASYKTLLDAALRPEWADALRIGLATHNLFDVAWGLQRATAAGAAGRVELEMLEGMAPAQARAAQAAAGDLLLYAPVVADADFDAAIAYLTRRLDENTQPDNFLRALFALTPDSPAFAEQAARFRTAVQRSAHVSTARRRAPLPRPDGPGAPFTNTPDGDPTDPAYRDDVQRALAAPPRPQVTRTDTVDGVDAVVARAHAAFSAVTPERAQRREWLLAAAALMEAQRADTIALMAHTTGKTVREGDPEVSEAVDFCRYYPTAGATALDAAAARGVEVEPRGVVLVVAPWNFPYAIPVGGVAAALAAGNSVILKPAPEATALGAWIVGQFHDAGVPDDVLQLVVCPDDEVGRHLVTHPLIDTVVLTGAFDTAARFLDWQPRLRLFAETSGKNALVITAAADVDLAIADLVRSAFGHAGQKCSAASLGIVEASLYDDPSFRRRLADAVRSLRVGAATDPASMVGPLIAPPSGPLARALTTLDDGESWLVAPEPLDDTGRLWSPGVRLGVAAGSWFHTTECFGPVLGLLRADHLDHAIALQNATGYGLTGGIHSLDDDEVTRWLAEVEVGNAYVNRHITGAVVQRQPFGGWKRSSVGGGAKAGGPDYVAQFTRTSAGASRVDGPDGAAAWRRAFPAAWRERCTERDASGLASESNVLRHVPLRRVLVRHDGAATGQPSGRGAEGSAADTRTATALDVLRAAAAASGVTLDVSDRQEEDPATFLARADGADRVRILTGSDDLDDDTRRALHRMGVAIDTDQPVADAALELRHWTREQAVSRTLHRHGRVRAATSAARMDR